MVCRQAGPPGGPGGRRRGLPVLGPRPLRLAAELRRGHPEQVHSLQGGGDLTRVLQQVVPPTKTRTLVRKYILILYT